jgi:hypothetical protein
VVSAFKVCFAWEIVAKTDALLADHSLSVTYQLDVRQTVSVVRMNDQTGGQCPQAVLAKDAHL